MTPDGNTFPDVLLVCGKIIAHQTSDVRYPTHRHATGVERDVERDASRIIAA
jgi:hypothetical protein